MIAESPKPVFARRTALPWRETRNAGCSCFGVPVTPRRLSTHIMRRALFGCLLSFILAIFVAGSAEANAAEGAKGDGLYVMIPPFVANLHDPALFLQITMVLKVANPALAETLKANMPIILNELTYLLSDKDAGQLESPAGKQLLIKQARGGINKALSLSAKDGVTDVFLVSMFVQ